MNLFKDKVVFITGSSRGLGKAMALEFAAQGATLLLHASKKSKEATNTLREIQKFSPSSTLHYANFLKRSDIGIMCQKIQKDFNRIDILINNAGAIVRKTFNDQTESEWDEVIQVNVYGTFYVTKLLLPIVTKGGGGRILNTSSICGLIGEYGLTSYCASKAAIIGLTKSLSKELAKYDITVNAICPAFTDAGMATSVSEKITELNLQAIPLKRVGKKEEVAKLALFLCSADAGYITGQAININGGLT